MPTILTKKSDTPGSIPATANLTNAAGGAELAVNTADKRLFTITSGSQVVELGTNPASLTCADVSATVLRAGSATITNLLATTLTVSGVGIFPAGSATVAAITTVGDTNTGIFFPAADTIAFTEGGAEAARFDSSGNLCVGSSQPGNAGVVNVSVGNPGTTVGGLQLWSTTSSNHFVQFGDGTAGDAPYRGAVGYLHGSDALVLYSAATERARIDSSGNLGLGVTPSAWQTDVKAIQIGDAGSNICANNAAYSGANNVWINSNSFQNSSVQDIYIRTATAGQYNIQGSTHIWKTAPSGTAGNTISFTQAMTLDASSNLSVGTTSNLLSAASRVTVSVNGTSSSAIAFGVGDTRRGHIYVDGSETVFAAGQSGQSQVMAFQTNGTERARITSGGTLLVGKTADSDTGTGVRLLADGLVQATREADPLSVNRINSDGTVVSIRQDGVEEGTISVSGNTVSYNAFAGSHWSQLQDGSKPDILRGTVMESINELCVWPGEQNERLPKAKISDTAGSKKVYGVFMAWDNDWTETNDMYVTAVGAFICRVNGSVTVQEGDLLESNGDGTARVQADDIIRSSTIGKVTSTVKTHEYDDGSYCVPTVLYCG